MAPARRPSKSKYTLDRGIPGAFEGETVTSRRFMTGTAHGAGMLMATGFALPALGFAIGPIFKNVSLGWQTVGPPDCFPDNNYVPAVIMIAPGIGEAGKTTVYMRKRNPASTRRRRPSTTAGSRSRRAARTSAARCAGCRPPSASSAPATAASTTPRAFASAARRRARSTASTRACTTAWSQVGPRYSVNSELRAFSPRDPGEPLDGLGQYLVPVAAERARHVSMPEAAEALPCPPTPAAGSCRQPPAAPGTQRGRPHTPLEHAAEAGKSAVDWIDERTSLSGGARWAMFRKVPKGTNWFYTLGSATMFAFLSQAVTGVFLAMYYRPDAAGGAYESIRYISNKRLPRPLRPRHAQLGRDGDGRPRLPAHGAHVRLRRLQVPARAQLGDRRRAADPDDGDVASPATCCRSTSAPTGRRSSASTSTAPGRCSAPT